MPQPAFASPEEVLIHFGKKGMKWGVRNEERDAGGRITPQKAPAVSERRQQRVDKFMKRSEGMNTKISELKVKNEALENAQTLGQRITKTANQQHIRGLERQQQQAVRDAEAAQQGKLTRKQKQVIAGAVGVSAIAGVVGVGLVLRGQQSGALNSTMLRGSAFIRGEKVPFNVNKELSKRMSASELLNTVAKPVNPNYRSAGGKMNCRRSTFAYELRRRGFDVHATTSSIGWGQSESGFINAVTTEGKDFFRQTSLSETVMKTGATQKAVGDKRLNPIKKIVLDDLLNKSEVPSTEQMLENLRRGKNVIGDVGTISSSKQVLQELAKQPNGARGEVVFRFPGFGHSMAYEVVDGVPHIFDSQKGTLYNEATKMVESKWDGFHGAEITRLDNVDLDLNFLSRWATNTGGKPRSSDLLGQVRKRIRERTTSDFDVSWT
jgi:hypothetical protein